MDSVFISMSVVSMFVIGLIIGYKRYRYIDDIRTLENRLSHMKFEADAHKDQINGLQASTSAWHAKNVELQNELEIQGNRANDLNVSLAEQKKLNVELVERMNAYSKEMNVRVNELYKASEQFSAKYQNLESKLKRIADIFMVDMEDSSDWDLMIERIEEDTLLMSKMYGMLANLNCLEEES